MWLFQLTLWWRHHLTSESPGFPPDHASVTPRIRWAVAYSHEHNVYIRKIQTILSSWSYRHENINVYKINNISIAIQVSHLLSGPARRPVLLSLLCRLTFLYDMNMSNITCQILSLSTFVFNKCSEIIIFTIIFVVKHVKSLKRFGWNNVGPASQTVA